MSNQSIAPERTNNFPINASRLGVRHAIAALDYGDDPALSINATKFQNPLAEHVDPIDTFSKRMRSRN